MCRPIGRNIRIITEEKVHLFSAAQIDTLSDVLATSAEGAVYLAIAFLLGSLESKEFLCTPGFTRSVAFTFMEGAWHGNSK